MSFLINPYRGAVSTIPYWTQEALAGVTSTGNSVYHTLISTVQSSAAGQFVGFWSCDVLNSTFGGTDTLRLKIDGTVIEQQDLYIAPSSEAPSAGGMFFFTSDGSGHTFLLEGTNDTGNATFSNNRISLVKLGAADAKQENLPVFHRSATSFATAATFSFTPAASGDYVLVCTFNVERTAPDPTVQLSDGTTTIQYELTGIEREGCLWMLPITGSAGVAVNVTLKLKSNSTSQVGIENMRLLALRKDRFAHVYTARTIVTTNGTNSSYATDFSQTFTPANADHLTLAGIIGMALDTSHTAHRYSDGADVVSEVKRWPIRSDVTDAFTALRCHRIANYAAASRLQKIERRAINSVQDSTAAGSMVATFDLTGI